MKRYLPMMLAALLVFTLFSGVSYAANEISVTIESATGAVGDTVDVQLYADLTLSPGYGLETLQGTIAFDKGAVKLLNVEYGEMLTSLESTMFNDNQVEGGFFFVFVSAAGRTKAGETPDGLLMTLSFELLTDRGTALALRDAQASFFNSDTEQHDGTDIASVDGYINAGNGAVKELVIPVAEDMDDLNSANWILIVGIIVVVAVLLGYLAFLIQKKRKNNDGEKITMDSQGGAEESEIATEELVEVKTETNEEE